MVTLISALEGAEAHFLVTHRTIMSITRAQVSEVLHGGDLFDRLYGPEFEGCFPEAAAASNAERLFDALAHIHKHGWIHRDLKVLNGVYTALSCVAA